jgi:hypothetical protein
MTKTQAEIVAEIALDLPDAPVAARILAAIHQGFEAGREFERISSDAKNERYRQIVAEVLST